MASDGDQYVKRIAGYIRTNEKRLASSISAIISHASKSTSNGGLRGLWPSSSLKPVTLSLTPHHLFYLLTRCEGLDLPVGPMKVRLEILHNEYNPVNYVSFLNSQHRSRRKHLKGEDSVSIRSVSSIQSVMSTFSLWNWSKFSGKEADASAIVDQDLKYLYSAFTKLPSLRLAPDKDSRLISGFEEYPFDTAVPLLVFKNVNILEVAEVDIRVFFGWDVIAERLQSLVVRKGGIQDVSELIVDIVLDDAEKRRHRSSRNIQSPQASDGGNNSPILSSPASDLQYRSNSEDAGQPSTAGLQHQRNRSISPKPAMFRSNSSSSARPPRPRGLRRSNTVSSNASSTSLNRLADNATLPPSKWRFLRYLSLADNSLVSVSANSMQPLAGSLVSLDLSNNLLNDLPSEISQLVNLRSLSLSSNMIESLHSVLNNPLPALTTLLLRGNRLFSLAGIEKFPLLERLDLRDNRIIDPAEISRLTSTNNLKDIWIAGNPFTRTHTEHRTILFEYFRAGRKQIEDIKIDGLLPTIVEKRSLSHRISTVDSTAGASPDSMTNNTLEAPVTSTTVCTDHVKKRNAKGRIVSIDSVTPENRNGKQDSHRNTPSPRSVRNRHSPIKVKEDSDSGSQSLLNGIKSDIQQPPGEELYRRKMEALRADVGKDWLRVLQETGSN